MTKHAIQLAQALDAEDYVTARKQLAPNCIYEFRGTVIEGADAIIDSYRTSGQSGQDRFDTIVYESSVSPLARNRARIDYTDIVTLAGESHVHRCAQEVLIGQDGRVSRILHLDLPGECEALQEFEKRHT